MRDQDTFIGLAEVNLGVDQIAAATDIGRDLCRKVAHSGMKHVALARAVNSIRVHHETFAEAIVENI